MKIATAGIGNRSGTVLARVKHSMPEAEFVGYFDPQPTHLDKIGGNTPGYDSVEELLTKTKPDLLFVGSPNPFHLDQIRAGLEADVRVFTEKPIVTSLAQTWELARLLQKHGTDRVMVGLVLRHSQHMIDLRAAQQAGWLGDIVSLEANVHIGPYHGAFFMRDWRRHTHLSGGFMLEKCCHDIDIYNMVVGARARYVASFGGRKTFLPENAPTSCDPDDIYQIKKSVWNSVDDPFRSDGDIVDYQTALVSYESGATLAFHTNLFVPDEQRRFCIIGTKGMAEGDFARGYLNITDAASGKRRAAHNYTSGEDASLNHYGADHMMVDDVISHLRGEDTNLPVSAVDALEAGVVALMIDEARRTKQVVDLREVWEKFDSYGMS